VRGATEVLDAAVLGYLSDVVCVPARVDALEEIATRLAVGDLGETWRALVTADHDVGRAYAIHLIERAYLHDDRANVAKSVAARPSHALVQVEAVALHRERRPCGANSIRVARAAVGFVLARREHRQCPAVQGDRRAAIQGRELRRLVRALFERSLIEQAATPEPQESAITYPAHDGLELDERGSPARGSPRTARIASRMPIICTCDLGGLHA
jgi:hypothetical protein